MILHPRNSDMKQNKENYVYELCVYCFRNIPIINES